MSVAKKRKLVNILFADIQGYTTLMLFLLFLNNSLTAQSPSAKEQAYQYLFEDVLSGNLADTAKLQFFVANLNDLSAKGSTLPLQYAQKGIALAQQINSLKWQGLLQLELGWIYQGLNKISLAEEQYKEAIQLFQSAQLPIQLSKAHGKLSLLYGQTKRSDQALQQAKEAIRIAEEVNDELGIAYGYYATAYNFINSRKEETALPYIEQSIQLYQKHKEVYRIAVLMENKVTCFLNLGKPQEALATANELISLVQENKIGRDHPNDRYYRAQALFSRAKVYIKLQQYEKALADNERLQTLLSNDGASLVEAIYIFQKAKILYQNQQYQASKKICLELLQHPTIKAERFLGYTYDYLSKNCAALRQFQCAYRYHLALEEHAESEVELASKLKLEELQAQHEAEQKEATIASQEQALLQQRMINWTGLGFLGILGLLLVQTYSNSKNRKSNNEALQLSNNQLEQSNSLLAEKNKEIELLLKEIHHRVKNNLEIVSSLLELQAARIPDALTQRILQDSQNRVQSMGIVHQKLYQGGNLRQVEMRDYFKNLSESLLETFDAWDRIDIQIDMEKLNLDIEKAIPIGLIVNELLTNAWKYAFPKTSFANKTGIIQLSLNSIDPHLLRLVVADNGIGKSPTAPIQGTGFGSQLVGLLTQQLNGTMKEEHENGSRFVFEFKK